MSESRTTCVVYKAVTVYNFGHNLCLNHCTQQSQCIKVGVLTPTHTKLLFTEHNSQYCARMHEICSYKIKKWIVNLF